MGQQMNTTANDNRAMVELIQRRGVTDERVLNAMRSVPRHLFVPETAQPQAYSDFPLPIGHGQTISQPYIVARTLELLDPRPDMVVLDVGAGSGYQTAVLARICKHVYAVERHAELADRARQAIAELGMRNVEVLCRDGSLGLPEEAPFDRIVVGAGAPQVPIPLVEQLADQGKLVIPVGTRFSQVLTLVLKEQGRVREKMDIGCRFVDLIGKQAWSEPQE